MAELEHPGILPIHQFGQQDGVLFFTMKLAAGGTLAERTADYAGQWRRIGGADRERGGCGAVRARARGAAPGHQAGEHSL
jgi:hypothetical protein